MSLKYDLHLSAYEISKETIAEFENLGFQRDEFSNNTNCDITVYHGTYKGLNYQPGSEIWSTLCELLQNDDFFSGSLEEESFETESVAFFLGKGNEIKPTLPALKTKQPAPNTYKACDIHISIDLEDSRPTSISHLENLGVASFDRYKNGKMHRIYTITTETLEDGYKTFSIINDYLKDIKGIVGKMKLEKTTRHLRKPLNAPSLPLTNCQFFQEWLKKIEQIYAE